MKNTTNAKELSRLLSEKTGLTFEAENYHDLAKFVEEIVPAISKKDIFGNSPYDCPTYSFESLDMYFDFSNHFPFWTITADKKTLTAIWNLFAPQDVFQETTFYYNDDADSESDHFDDMPDEGEIYAHIDYPQGDIIEVLEQLRAFSAESNTSFSFGCYNLYPYDDLWDLFGDDGNGIVWRIENGNITTDGQEIVILNDTKGFQLLIQCWWLDMIEVEKLEKYGVRVMLETAEDAPKTWQLRECGITTGLRIEYGVLGEPRQVITKQDAIALVEKTPIVYDYLPEELQKDRDLAIAFIKNNDRYAAAYRGLLIELDNDIDEKHLLRSSSSVRAENEELFLDGMPWDFPEVLGRFTDDAEVLAALGSTPMWSVVTFTDENYNEKIVSKAIENGPCLVHPLFDYWYERLNRDKKTDEHIREKYELAADDSLFIVTAFKCIEIIDAYAKNPNRAYASLFMECNSFCFDGEHVNNRDEVWNGYWTLFSDYQTETARIFRVFPVEKQNELAYSYFFLASLIKPADVDPELAELIVKECPIARQLLPDEYILRYNLTGDQECVNCRKCGKCYLSNVIIG